MLVVLIGVSTWLQFVVVTDLEWQMVTFDGIWHFGEVFSSRMNPGFHCIWQMADVYGVVWVSGLLMSMLWIEWPMVAVRLWYRAGVCYGQQTQVHFIDGILNAQRYRDEILRLIVLLFIHDHHLMLQHDNARLHVAKIYTQFLEAHLLSVFGMFWIGVYDSGFQFLPISSNFAQPLNRSGPAFHRPQSITWSTLCEGDVLHCVRKKMVTPDTDWFSETPPQ